MGQTAAPPQHKAGTNRLDPAACTIDNRLDLTLALSSRHYRMARPSLCPWGVPGDPSFDAHEVPNCTRGPFFSLWNVWEVPFSESTPTTWEPGK
ncbi:hypothetical protein GQ607_000350 [Colletotrichum asianum]|uniref:Uncharacterized protein n=1 Tax=Colletotrichum asianum TaxID=702518 RepID=A0A8H3ZTU0_9PEZI|nr:hypothetical protein GQ607_000350 [Colletotrichum asianum]